MVKLNGLKVEQLNVLLEKHSLSATGTKAHKIGRLMEIYETGEVQDDELEGEEGSTLQKQVDELREMIANMSKAVAELVSNKDNQGEAVVQGRQRGPAVGATVGTARIEDESHAEEDSSPWKDDMSGPAELSPRGS